MKFRKKSFVFLLIIIYGLLFISRDASAINLANQVEVNKIAFVRAGSIWVLNLENEKKLDIANSLKELMHEMIEKIDWDVDNTSTAFADAKNIQRNLKWADIFGAGLNIVNGTIDTISSLLTLKDLSHGLSNEFLKYELPLEVFSGLLTVDSLIESGGRLQLAIEGPSYSSSIKKMLDEAYIESSTRLFFNYEAYRTTIKHHLLGLYGFTPIVIPHRSLDITRKNIEIVHGAGKVEKAIRKRFRDLIKELEKNPLPDELEREMIIQIDRIRKNILRSKLHRTKVEYKTYLEDGFNYIPVEPEIWLGNTSELEKVRSDALRNFDKKLAREEIITFNKMVRGIVNATTIYLNINYPSSKLGKSLGQISKVFMLPPGLDLSEKIMKTAVYKTNPREQVNMLPQEMLLSLPKELSDLWMIADDVTNYIKYYIDSMKDEEGLGVINAALALVVDSTGSMRENDPDGSRIYGGEIALDQAETDWEIGMIDFDTTSKLLVSGTPKDSKLKDALRLIDSSGGTNIQAGLDEAYNYLLVTKGEKKGAVLLTDGEHNTPSSDFDYSKYVEIFIQEGWPVYTIGLTGSANEILLSKIAKMTGGKYFKAEQSRDMIYIFDLILSAFKLEGLVFSQEGKIRADEIKDFPFYSDSSNELITLTGTYPGSKLDFSLVDPSGKEINQTDKSKGVEVIKSRVYKIIKVKNPVPGNWKARVVGLNVKVTGELFKIKISAKTPIRIETKGIKPFYQIFEPIRFKAEITGDIDKNSVQGLVKVTPPEGKTEEISLKRTMDIVYNKSGNPGVYYFDIKVKGKTKAGEQFMRETIQHVVVSSEGREFGAGEVVRSLGGYIEINLGEEVGLRPGKKIFVFITKEGTKQKIAEGFVLSVSIGKSMVELTRVWNTIPQKGHRVEIERETGKY